MRINYEHESVQPFTRPEEQENSQSQLIEPENVHHTESSVEHDIIDTVDNERPVDRNSFIDKTKQFVKDYIRALRTVPDQEMWDAYNSPAHNRKHGPICICTLILLVVLFSLAVGVIYKRSTTKSADYDTVDSIAMFMIVAIILFIIMVLGHAMSFAKVQKKRNARELLANNGGYDPTLPPPDYYDLRTIEILQVESTQNEQSTDEAMHDSTSIQTCSSFDITNNRGVDEELPDYAYVTLHTSQFRVSYDPNPTRYHRVSTTNDFQDSANLTTQVCVNLITNVTQEYTSAAQDTDNPQPPTYDESIRQHHSLADHSATQDDTQSINTEVDIPYIDDPVDEPQSYQTILMHHTVSQHDRTTEHDQHTSFQIS